MNKVYPIKSKKMIKAMKEDLLEHNGMKGYMMMVLQLNLGLRISDVITLKVMDLLDKKHLRIKEQKTGKTKDFLINSQLQKEIKKYVKEAELKDNDYLFQSRQKNSEGIKKNISRVQAYRILKASADRLGIENFGTHSIRKTFGYFYYQKTNDLTKLMKIFNHSAPSVTAKYIGIEQEELDESLEDFFL
ncbi:site-specific integrase [Clostridium ganghwense]|uniref:Site-specific integrase n=1 Tax=Clostridium ganghwense TaxID=312089 RepID=A0ABT4CUM1_9CLOT|nr:site-specific integrase [Clostridium ganghwense]MCY6372773.1 site-specific integrase [Clostridium ganghwense]